MLLFLIPTSGVLSSSLSHLWCLDLLVLLLLLLDGRLTRVLPGGHLGDGVDEVRLLVPYVKVDVLNTCMVRGTSGSRGVSVCHALHEGEARSQGSRHSACMRIIFRINSSTGCWVSRHAVKHQVDFVAWLRLSLQTQYKTTD